MRRWIKSFFVGFVTVFAAKMSWFWLRDRLPK
jgi:hypothetical protein